MTRLDGAKAEKSRAGPQPTPEKQRRRSPPFGARSALTPLEGRLERFNPCGTLADVSFNSRTGIIDMLSWRRLAQAVGIGFAFAVLTAGPMPLLQSAFAQTPRSVQTEIPDIIWKRMVGRTWHPRFPQCASCRCPPRESLVLLSLPYRDFAGEARTGEMVVARKAARTVMRIFGDLFEKDCIAN